MNHYEVDKDFVAKCIGVLSDQMLTNCVKFDSVDEIVRIIQEFAISYKRDISRKDKCSLKYILNDVIGIRDSILCGKLETDWGPLLMEKHAIFYKTVVTDFS